MCVKTPSISNSTFASSVQFKNAFAEIEINVFGNLIDVKPEQPLKQEVLMYLRLSGRTIVVSDVLPANKEPVNDSTFEFSENITVSITGVPPVKILNASQLIVVIDDGI